MITVSDDGGRTWRTIWTLDDYLQERGLRFDNAPRANPEDRLHLPYVLRDRTGRIVARGNSRDELETVAYRYLRRQYQCHFCGSLALPTDAEDPGNWPSCPDCKGV